MKTVETKNRDAGGMGITADMCDKFFEEILGKFGMILTQVFS